MQCPLCNRSIIRLTSVQTARHQDFNTRSFGDNSNGREKVQENSGEPWCACQPQGIAAARFHRARDRIADRVGALPARARARWRGRGQRAAQGIAHRLPRSRADPGRQGAGAQPAARWYARQRTGTMAPARSGRTFLGFCGRTGAGSPARAFRAAQHRRAGGRRAGGDAPQPAAPRPHAARARCDVAAHAARAGRAPGRQGISRRVAAGHRESFHRVAHQWRDRRGECADRVQAAHRAAQARSGAGSLARVRRDRRQGCRRRARAAMAELIRLAIMDTPIKQRPKPPVAARTPARSRNY